MTTEQKHLATYMEMFVHRRDLHARQTTRGSYFLKRESVTDELIRAHLEGEITAAWYGLQPDSTTRWVALDADRPDGPGQLQDAWKQLDSRGIASHLELSRRGGHLWIFFEPIAASAARRLILGALPELEGVEVFPKQDRLGEGQVGSALRGPLGIHCLSGQRYPFVDPMNLNPVSATIEGTIEYLSTTPRLNASQVAEHLATLLDEAKQPREKLVAREALADLRSYKGLLARDIKEQIGDLRTFVSRFVELDASGRGACPFHPPDRHASFSVHPSGYWVCFHEVNPRTGRYLGGDAIDFYMKLKRVSFRDALHELQGFDRAADG